MLIIQEIITRWTKESRGAPGAVLRNQVPEVLSIPTPSDPMTDDTWIYQKVIFDEHKKFKDPFEQLDLLTPFKLTKFGIAEITEQSSCIAICINYGAWDGAPRRDFLKKKAFLLMKGDFGQIRYNWRISYDEGGWAYQKTTLNIAYAVTYEPNLFQTQQVTLSFEDMPTLW
jgi:hypothetical protein